MIATTTPEAAQVRVPRLRTAAGLLTLAAALAACASAPEGAPVRLVATAAAYRALPAPPYPEAEAGRAGHGLRGDVAMDQINMDYAIQRAQALRMAELSNAAKQVPPAAGAPASPPVPALARASSPVLRAPLRMKPVYVAQIGSLASLEAARAEWIRAARHAPVLLKAKTVLVRPSLQRRGRFHLIVASFEDARAARLFCGGLHRRHLACLVMHHREAA